MAMVHIRLDHRDMTQARYCFSLLISCFYLSQMSRKSRQMSFSIVLLCASSNYTFNSFIHSFIQFLVLLFSFLFILSIVIENKRKNFTWCICICNECVCVCVFVNKKKPSC